MLNTSFVHDRSLSKDSLFSQHGHFLTVKEILKERNLVRRNWNDLMKFQMGIDLPKSPE